MMRLIYAVRSAEAEKERFWPILQPKRLSKIIKQNINALDVFQVYNFLLIGIPTVIISW